MSTIAPLSQKTAPNILQRANHFRNNRKPFPTTNKLAPTSANTAIHMVPVPISVNTKNTALMPSASTMFCTSKEWV